MGKLGSYINGNYRVTIFEDGTKVRDNKLDCFVPEKPESMDIKITNQCDCGCPFCHENSVPDGKHGDILDIPFLDTLLPYTELAIGGGNPLAHPDLIPFLKILKEKNLIANMTVNQKHFLASQPLLQNLTKENLVHGLGVSLTDYSDELFFDLHYFPNAVLHIINGVVNLDDLKKFYDEDFKILILGYKQFRRGKTYYSEKVESEKSKVYEALPELIEHFKVVSFDNLAIKQLDVKRLLSDDEWAEMYMGDDGQFTMYVDMVNREFAKSSTSTTRYPVTENIKDMFKVVRQDIV